MTAPHRNVARVLDALAQVGLTVELRAYPEGVRTAEDAAAAISCPAGAIVKSMVMIADGEPVVVLTSGANRLDERKVAAALGAAQVRRADAAEVREATGFPIGGVAPLGHRHAVRVICDADLLAYSLVWAAAGTPQDVFGVAPDALARAADATVADVAAG